MKHPLILSLLLLVCSGSLFAQVPPNDNCSGAIDLPIGPTCTPTSGFLLNSTVSGTATGCTNRRDVWYKFTLGAATNTIVVNAALGSSPGALLTSNVYMDLYKANACPVGSTLIGSCQTIAAPRRYSGLVAGATYYLRINTTVTPTGPATHDFTVCLTSNDECATAADVTPGTLLDANLLGAGPSPAVAVGCATGDPDDDQWFKFTALYNYATIALSNFGTSFTAANARIQFFSGNCGALVSEICGTNQIQATGLTPGQTYYFRVYNSGTGQTGTTWTYKVLVSPAATAAVSASRMSEVFEQTVISGNNNLADPWEIIYGPDDNLWITESKGYRVIRVNVNTWKRDTVLNISQGSTFLPLADQGFNCQFNNGSGAQGGLAGMALHPKFLDPLEPKPYVYVAYVHSQQNANKFTNRIVRFKFNFSTNRLEEPVSIVDTLPGSNDHNSQRMIIVPVNSHYYLFYASGDMGAGQFGNVSRPQNAQNLDSYEGKILRFHVEPDNDPDPFDRWIPSNGNFAEAANPFNQQLGRQSAIWSLGIRNNQGFVYDSKLDKLYGSSHGPFSDDEINVIERGRNYGHPLVIGYTDGNADSTTAGASPNMSPPHPSSCPLIVSEVANAAAIGPSYKDPLFSAYPNSLAFPSLKTLWQTTAGANAQWPSEGWSGLDLYTNTVIPGWKQSLVAASLKWGRLVRIRLNAAGTATFPTNTAADTVSYIGSINRYRDLAFSPDGKDIYVVMDKGSSSSGPSSANPVVPACAGCLQKYSFLGYNDDGSGKSMISPSVPVTTQGQLNSCITATTVTVNSKNNMYWVPITGPDGNILAEIFPNGQNLGTITSSFHMNGAAVRRNNGMPYADRNITITPQTQPGAAVKIRLYITRAEYDRLAADPLSSVTSINDLRIYKNSESCKGNMGTGSVIINPTSAEAFGTDGYVLQASISGFSSFYFAATSLTLSSSPITFTGNYKDDISYLKWETKNEINTESFVVERSVDNLVYSSIGTVNAKGGADEKVKYSLNDAEAAKLGVAKLYYRLRIVYNDGSYTYSKIVVLDIPGSLVTKVTVFPNPAEKQTTVMIISAGEQMVKWQLIDVTGRKITGKETLMKKGENKISLDLSNLKSGTYFIQLNGQYINVQEKIQKL